MASNETGTYKEIGTNHHRNARKLRDRGVDINWVDWLLDQRSTTADQAGRERVSQPIPLGDYKLLFNRLPQFFDTVESGGTVAYNTVLRSHNMQTAADGNYAIVQTFQRHNYFAGKSQFVELTCFDFDDETNVEKRTGYYSSNTAAPYQSNLDGFYLYTDGTEHYLRIINNGTEILNLAQSEWDDPLDGTGFSRFTIDWQNFNVFQFSFLWLGGTGIRFSLVSGERIIQVHSYNHIESANADKLIFSRPNHPIRHEIIQSGVGSGQFQPVCSTVITEGSESSGNIGEIITVDSGVATDITLTYPERGVIKGVRLKEFGLILDLLSVTTFAETTNDFYRWEVVLNPDLVDGADAPATLTWSDVGSNPLEEVTGDGAVFASGGTTLYSGYGSARSALGAALSSARKLGGSITGVPDEVYLVITPLQGTTNINVFGSITLKAFV